MDGVKIGTRINQIRAVHAVQTKVAEVLNDSIKITRREFPETVRDSDVKKNH
jgi:hypothetical protein